MGELKADQNNDETKQELLRCLSRLSFVGMGQSKELDEALNGLRNSIKKEENVPAVKQQVENISKVLINLEDKKSSLKKNEVSADLELLEQLLSRSLPSDFKKALKAIEKERKNRETAQIIASIADHIEAFLSQGSSKQSKGLFGKLFGKSKNDRKAAEDSETVDSESQEKSRLSNAEYEEIPDELRISLLHLIEQLSAIENNQDLARKLNKKISQLSHTSQLVEILEAVTGAFVDFTGHEHEQFEKFLKSLSQRIDRVNEFIIQTTEFNKTFTENSQKLDEDLKNSVSSLKESIESRGNLGEIKDMLSTKMDSIVSRVNQFCEQQQQNHQALTDNCEKLKEQLTATQDESSRLKEELAAQRLRAHTDPLTRLPNRYSYNDRLTQEYNRWRRYRSPLSLVVGDIDFFKKVNDQYGHAVGDDVLKEIAVFLQTELRESDFVARYGGEEFVILLPETSLVDATKAMNKLRQGVKELTITADSQEISVSMSFGIAEFENNDTPKAVFSRADKALYRAKEKGRDQVCCQRAKSL